MFKAVYFSALTLASFSSVLGAWGQKSLIERSKDPIDTHFPLSSNQAWAVEESLLIWKTYEDDVDYAVLQNSQLSSSPQQEEYRVKHPDFKWGTGVRLKLTRYLPSHDLWDISFLGTYYYSHGKGHVHINSASDTFPLVRTISSTWDTAGVGIAQEASAHTQMNFFTFDLTAGRYYSLTRKIDIHPFLGLRSVLNYQRYKSVYLSSISLGEVPFTKTSFNGGHDFWGLGPRVGADLVMHFGRHWSFLAAFSGSFFAGRYDVKEVFKGKTFVQGIATPYSEKLSDGDTVLRSNIEASLGIGWEKWVKGGTVRIAHSFVFEVSEWFAMNRWVDTHNASNTITAGTPPKIQTHRRYSDLGLMGFNINLKVDF